MTKVYKYTIIVMSFIMFLSFILLAAYEENQSQIYAEPTNNEIEVIV